MERDLTRGVLSTPCSGTASRHVHPSAGTDWDPTRPARRCVRAMAAALAALAVAGTAGAQEAYSYAHCTAPGAGLEETIRISSSRFSMWHPHEKTWDEYCFEGERLARGGKTLTTTCQIDGAEVNVAMRTNEGSLYTFRIDRTTGRMIVRGLYVDRPNVVFDCAPTSNPDEGTGAARF
jgi:hypothetical protein